MSLSVALQPCAGAQSTVTQRPANPQQQVDTSPLPGAKVASQFVEQGTLTPLGIATVAALAVIGIIVAANASNDEIAVLATNLTATTGTR